jgi:Replication-relaxation
MLPRSYTELARYDGAAVQRDERKAIIHCAIQPRDLAVVIDVWRYKFLTSTQILELHWNGCVPRVANKRLTKLFDTGLVDRFRPVARTGSFPWTYQLGPRAIAWFARSAGSAPAPGFSRTRSTTTATSCTTSTSTPGSSPGGGCSGAG